MAADGETVGDLLVLERGPQAVGADEQNIVRLQLATTAQGHVGKNRIASDAALHEVSHRMVHGLLGGDQAFAQEQLDMAVVARAHDDTTLAEVIHATVANMRPPRSVLLHEDGGAGRARPLLERQRHADAHDFLMRPAKCHVQEAQRIEQGLRGVPERFEYGFLGDFGRAGAIGVPAHAVDHEKQSRVLGHCRNHTILVFFARSEQ